jgi:uncharacterized protein
MSLASLSIERVTRVAGGRIDEVEVRVRAPRLPPAFDGLVAVQITDLHLPFGERLLGELCDYVAGQAPDLWLLTGDMLESVAGLPMLERIMAGVRPEARVFTVLGNNDNRVLDRRPAVRAELGRLCGTVLVNEATHIARDGERVHIVGVDDASRLRHDAALAMEAVPEGEFVLMLSHCVDALPDAGGHGVDVMVAGHSHGGQICLPLWGPIISGSRIGGRQLAHGVHGRGDTVAYVSRGIGASVLPFRLFCRPEVTRYRFECAPA